MGKCRHGCKGAVRLSREMIAWAYDKPPIREGVVGGVGQDAVFTYSCS